MRRDEQDSAVEIGCHPGWDPDLETMYCQERLREVEVLCGPTLKESIAAMGFELVGFAAIAPRATGEETSMTTGSRRKIVLLGMMTKIPVAGAVWGTMHYMVGLRRLGYDPYYVEAHARTPSMLMQHESDDGSALAAAYIDGVMRYFDMQDRWAYHALHDDGPRLRHERHGPQRPLS